MSDPPRSSDSTATSRSPADPFSATPPSAESASALPAAAESSLSPTGGSPHDATVAWPQATAGDLANDSPAPADLSAESGNPEAKRPETIGKYRIIGSLDAGGQGAVYRAVHPQLEKELVVKLGRLPLAEVDKDRLVAEARLLADLDHPNLARVYDLDVHDGHPYLVMEYIRGRTLRQCAQAGEIGWREAVRIVAQVAHALSAAHSRGVLHLDIKPDNIIVDENGTARLIDFGMARLKHAWSDDAPAPGSVSGTIPFMAPEQARGENDRVDYRADVFALGAVLYWLLTGKAPFAAGTLAAALDAAGRCYFDRAALARADVPQAVKDACFKALRAEADERHSSASALADELERITSPRSNKWTLASISVGNLGCALTVTTCSLLIAVGLSLWFGATRDTATHDQVAMTEPQPGEGKNGKSTDEPPQPPSPIDRSAKSDYPPIESPVGVDAPPEAVPAPPPDEVEHAVEPSTAPFLDVADAAVGDWAELAGEVVRSGDKPSRRKIRYRFEVRERTSSDAGDQFHIAWTNDDPEGEESGEFTVAATSKLSVAECLERLRGPFGGGAVTSETTEQIKFADRTWLCRRIERRRANEFGSLADVLWISPEAPAARVVAYRSRWTDRGGKDEQPPVTELKLELHRFGDVDGPTWSRDP